MHLNENIKDYIYRLKKSLQILCVWNLNIRLMKLLISTVLINYLDQGKCKRKRTCNYTPKLLLVENVLFST